MEVTEEKIISTANPHTIKKLELIEEYVKTWAHKLLQCRYCSTLVFVDCMCNSGEYIDDFGNQVWGTPVRVSDYLSKIARNYPKNNIELYFSDLSASKIDHLKSLLPNNQDNFHIYTSVEDGNDLLIRLGKGLSRESGKNYLVVYDPYIAKINWDAIDPFFNAWAEVIINHMVSDSMRAVKQAKSEEAVSKYEQTYLTKLEDLIPFGSDKKAYEKRVEEIIRKSHRNSNRDFFISAYPFFNEKNAIVYNLIHCTTNIEGFKLYKSSAWKTFGGTSSNKNTHGNENQLIMNFGELGNANGYKTASDEFCFYVKDIADYVYETFKGKKDVPLDAVWKVLDVHPIFPSDGFKQEIKRELKERYGVKSTQKTISFCR